MYPGRKNCSQPMNTSSSCSFQPTPGAGAERLGDPRLRLQRAERQHERARRVDAAVRVRQDERLLLGHRVGAAVGVELHVPAGRLAPQPLVHVARHVSVAWPARPRWPDPAASAL